MSQVVSELVYLFRVNRKNRPVLLLGAGASYRSGIPLAADAVRLIARAAYARQVRGIDWKRSNLMPSDWLPYLQIQDWFISDPKRFSENFPLAVENLLKPLEFRRELFMEMIQPPNGINEGYRYLAKIMRRGLCCTILTPNFDSLAAGALRELYPHVRAIVEVNRTDGDIVAFNLYNRYQIVYLHGAVEYYRDKNLLEETQRLDDKVVRRVSPLLRDSPLIVIGYRGAEPSVMHHLLEENIETYPPYPHGIYWCVRHDDALHENVLRLKEKVGPNFRLVEIDGFDELMEALDGELEGEALYHQADGILPVSPPQLDWDSQGIEKVSTDDLDHDLILATLKEYCDRLKLPLVDKQDYDSLLKEQRLLVESNGQLIPSRACYLLFGKNVSERFPFVRVSLTRGKKRIVFEGNLIKQYRELVSFLTSEDVNPILRVKGDRTAEEQPAYPDRALTELIVNILTHRDYQVQGYTQIELEPGQYIRFTNPGGLMPRVFGGVQKEADGRFYPVRGKTEIRNPQIADIFFGIGSMDKAGSGLPDVIDMMAEYGGRAEFVMGPKNELVSATLFQALQSEPDKSRTARRVHPFDFYITNLLPFRVIPKAVFVLPLHATMVNNAPLFSEGEPTNELPVFIRHAQQIITFADFQAFTDFAKRRGDLNNVNRVPIEDFLLDNNNRRLFVWLLGKHWEFFLRGWKTKGLFVKPREKKAFFQLVKGDRNTVTYDSRQRKNVRRDVVKQRGEGSSIWYENEGIAYEVTTLGNDWAIQVKPFYMFTASDGLTPLPGFERARRATRRIKFDRTKNVDDDLTFWTRFLSCGQPTMNVGGVGVNDLVLDSEYASKELPKPSAELS